MDVEALRDLWEADLELAGWETGPIQIVTSRPERTWIWSDLHFGDRGALEAFGRPFTDVASMNSHLVREWRYRVRAGDTCISVRNVGRPTAVPRARGRIGVLATTVSNGVNRCE